MKKVYQKPLAIIEKFELSQHIAACQNAMTPNQAIRQGCNADPKPDSGVPSGLFYTALTNDACTVDGEDMYCYTKGGSDTFVFTS